ncbi:tail fiber protein [Salmonella phage Sw2]|uniref:Tail fiber n=1 Tax=Salmonella phage Sw2 TaxID=2316014 RepID=A0A385INP2_9CAUD|nr:tail fiber protein [Salmonella phage Sw2]AXY85081.1 putative tail fiber [Salmonella phage Sw2]
MSRNLMPKSGAMAPYVVVNRDAAVAGVFSVDGEAGAVVLTSKYLQISKYNLDKQELNTRLTGIDSSIQSNVEAIGNINTAIGSINSTLNTKAAKGANNDITELNALTKAITVAQGGTGASTAENARVNLELNRFKQFPGETLVYSPYATNYFTVSEGTTWGVYSAASGTFIPLPIQSGGTGASTPAEALTKLLDGKPLALAADGQAPYDAVTVRQLANISGGGGANMSGVMNNRIGAVEWFNGNRTNLPAGYIPADGQLVSRTDSKTSDLWTAVNKGLYNKVSDALWINSGDSTRPYAWRASYSTGDGSTTFRVPDLNGAQLNSIKHLFLSGSSGGTNEPSANQVWIESLPNLVGSFPTAIASQFETGMNKYAERFGLPAVFGAENNLVVAPDGTFKSQSVQGDNPYGVTFNAAFSSRTYGRGVAYQKEDGSSNISYDARSIGATYPSHATGIWIIRANGAFEAANTDFSSVNADASAPVVSTTVLGGKLTSQYRVGAKDTYRMRMYAQGAYAQTLAGVIAVENQLASGIDGAYFNFGLDGAIRLGRATGGASTSLAYGYTPFRAQDWWNTSPYGAFVPIVGGGTGGPGGGWRSYTALGTLTMGSDINTHPNAMITQCWDYDLSTGASPSGNAVRNTIFDGTSYDITFGDNAGTVNYIFSKSPVSDRNKKKDIESLSTSIALENIKQMEYTSFKYIYDKGNQVRRGFIAQQLEEIDSQYVRKYESSDGSTSLALDENVLLLDALAAIQNLSNQVEELKLQIAELRAK